MITFYLTRHGRTEFNNEGKTQGWANSPLTEEGIEVVANLGKNFKKDGTKFSHAFSSDSGRAVDTTQIILENCDQTNVPHTVLEGIREWCFGTYEGTSYKNMWDNIAVNNGYEDMDNLFDANLPLEKMANMVHESDSEGYAENWDSIKTRVENDLYKIAEIVKKENGSNVLIVSHGLTIRTIIELIDSSKSNIRPVNAAITKIIYDGSNFEIKSVNEEYGN